MKRYASLCRVGSFCSLDVECETEAAAYGLTANAVTFRLINGIGDRLEIGFAVFAQAADGRVATDEGVFADLETAMRAHAAAILKPVEMPGRWRSRPPRHDTAQETIATAFDT